MRRRILSALLLALVFSFAAGSVSAERRVALVIGNGAYKNAPLRNPVNDAKDMAEAEWETVRQSFVAWISSMKCDL